MPSRLSSAHRIFERPIRSLVIGTVLLALLLVPIGSDTAQISLGAYGIQTATAQNDVELAPAPVVTDPSVLAPKTSLPARAGALAVDTSDRAAVVNLFNNTYTPTLAVPANWTGSLIGCNAGTVSDAYRQATITMVNYFRAMAGVPDTVTLDTASNQAQQQTALMMLAAGILTHTPTLGFPCYTQAGATAAATSNLALGAAGPQAVVAYMTGAGAGNTAVGQRRWILLPTQVTMATGSTTGTSVGPYGIFTGSNALNVQEPQGARPAGPAFVAWPPQGFVPYQIVYPRWSFSIPDADFSQATVTMTQGGASVGVSVLPVQPAFGSGASIGDNTLVWEPQVTFTAPAADTTYTVNVSNVRINGAAQNFTYNVTIINPATSGGTTGSIGGKGLGISAQAGAVQLTWSGGTGQTGYAVVRLANGFLTTLATLPATATSYQDTSAPNGIDCYTLALLGTNPQQFSDAYCALVGTQSPTGAPQNFTMRLNQSTTASFTWSPPAGGGQTGYILAKLGDGAQTLGATVISTLGSTNGPTCFQLQAVQSGTITGATNFLCGIPGFANLNP